MAFERRARRALFILASSLVLAVASPAIAEPTLSDRETARSLMDDGDAKRDKGDLKGALKSYEAADAIMRVPTTGLEVARAQAQLGLLLEARETCAKVMRLAPKPGEPAPFTAARKAAETLSTELATRIPSITVAVQNADAGQTPQITIDGEPVPPAAAEAPRKVNPGRHVIVVRAGSIEKKEDVSVAERDAKTVTIDLRAALPPPPVTEERAPAEGGGGDALPKILVFGGFGLAAVGIGVGSVTGLMSISKVDDVRKNSCNGGDACAPGSEAEIDSAKSLGTVSTIAFIAGGVGVAAGVIGILMGDGAKTETNAARVVTPRVRADVGPSWVGLSGTF
ncbi:MAG: hypothetical protein KF819_29700 [Labilithrix sp.]|nr:hypothetical protein [Labilithrix sp.]